MRYWSEENPHWNEEGHYQTNLKIMVCAGMWEEEIVGPYFFSRGNVTGEGYLEFLQTFLCDYLEHVPVLRRQNFFFGKMELHHNLLFLHVTTLTRLFQADGLVLWSGHLDHQIYHLLTIFFGDI